MAILIIFSLLETALLSAFVLIKKIAFGLRLLIILLILSAMVKFDNSADTIAYEIQEGAWERAFYRSEGEHWYHMTFTWLDNGVMIATKVMRPQETYRCIQYTDIEHKNCSFYLDRPYIFMTILETITAYATYILAIGFSLQLAQYLHWRREQHESPTPAPTTP